jgi:uncharacterized membrane protein HdeD (DUF308 family)
MALDMRGVVELARWWWAFLVRGVLSIVFGIVAFIAPIIGIAFLVGVFAAWAIVDGAAGVMTGIQSRGRDRSWWLSILEGLAGLIAGALALIFPVFAAEVLLLIIAAWAIVTGVFEIVAAIRLREQITGELWLALAGVASILFGLVLFLFPAAGALTVVWLIGGFAIAWGVLLVMLGLRLRRINELAKRDAAVDYAAR